jgi:hypothetical protein
MNCTPHTHAGARSIRPVNELDKLRQLADEAKTAPGDRIDAMIQRAVELGMQLKVVHTAEDGGRMLNGLVGTQAVSIFLNISKPTKVGDREIAAGELLAILVHMEVLARQARDCLDRALQTHDARQERRA